MKFPKHISLTIEHNPQAANYETVEEHIAWLEDHQNGEADFVSDNSKKKAIATNELWAAQWYPNTPIGFNSVYASTLEELLEYLAKVED